MYTKVSAIIEAYLLDESRLIIPNVGTLLKRKESGEIVFVEMLKNNDGKLEKLVEKCFEVSAEDAQSIVADYVERINSQLATSRKFIIDGVGVLLIGAGGAIDFAYNPMSHTIPEPEHKEPAPQPTVVVPEPPKVAEEPKVVAPEPKVEEPKPNVVTFDVDEDDEPAEPVAKKLQSALYDDDEPEQQKPEPKLPPKFNIRKPAKRKRLDPITIVAIVAVALAVASLIWGMFPSGNDLELDLTEQHYEMGEEFVLEEN